MLSSEPGLGFPIWNINIQQTWEIVFFSKIIHIKLWKK